MGPKQTKVKKTKPATVMLNDDDIMAAVTAVLSKSSSALADAQVTEIPQKSVGSLESVPSLAHSAPVPSVKKKPRKSRLSISWGPVDVVDPSTPSVPSNNAMSTPVVEEPSLSVVISRPQPASASKPHPSVPGSSTSEKTAIVNKFQDVHSSPVSGSRSPQRSASAVSAIPAGSQISEVTVQGQDEGSSDESEDSDEDHEKISRQRPSAKAPLLPSLSKMASSKAISDEVDIEALLRGPCPGRASSL